MSSNGVGAGFAFGICFAFVVHGSFGSSDVRLFFVFGLGGGVSGSGGLVFGVFGALFGSRGFAGIAGL